MRAPSMTIGQKAPAILTTVIAVVVASLAFCGSSMAGNVHIPGNKIAFVDAGTTLETYLKLAGLGEGDITIEIKA